MWGYEKEKDFDETYRCACHSAEHLLQFQYLHTNHDEDQAENEVYCSVFLSPTDGFFGRVWNAIHYVFGYRPQYGHFDCFAFKEKDIPKLVGLLSAAEKDIREARERFEAKKAQEKPTKTDIEPAPPGPAILALIDINNSQPSPQVVQAPNVQDLLR